jgi:uncharacterized protein (DUF1330 family)
MAAYAIFEITVTDPDRFEEYKKLAPPVIAAYGGRYLVRGGALETVEGDWQPKRLTILEFPTMERARQWLESPEYSAARAMRHAASHTNAVIVQGI